MAHARSLCWILLACCGLVLIAACMSFPKRNTSTTLPPASPPRTMHILPGGGPAAPLAQRLARGKLGPPRSSPGGPRTGSPGGHGGTYRGPGDAVSGGPGSPGPGPRTRTGSDEFYMGPTRRVAARSPRGIQIDRARRPLHVPPQRWQRAAKQPRFARVSVGPGKTLELVSMRVTVTIEGARARTLVDHVFRNPHGQRLEGTFAYPLPTGASPCYYAMFLTPEQPAVPALFPAAAPAGELATLLPNQVAARVDTARWGVLREARIVHRETARRTYETITRRQVDPALLEYAGGNTFRGRVFPIQPRGLNRILIAYEQDLDCVEGQLHYGFRLPDCALEHLYATLTIRRADVASATLRPADAQVRVVGRHLVFEHTSTGKGPGGELVASLVPTEATVQWTTGRDPAGRGHTFHATMHPTIPATTGSAFADRAVFLLDTSFSAAPDRFNANVAILQRILTADPGIRKFNIICFDTGAAWVDERGWIENHAAGRRRALAALDDVLLEGATDLSGAIGLLADTRWAGARRPGYVFLLTDGQVNWGKRRPATLARQLAECPLIAPRVFCYRTGLGADNLELFHELTRGGGGVFNVFTEAMAADAALAHRRPAFVVEGIDVPGSRDVLVAGRQAAIYPGSTLTIAGHFTDRPDHVLVRGRLDGRAKTLRFELPKTDAGTLAERAWAEIAVQQMLALHDPALEPLATAYAQRYRIGTRVTSFLVLEKDADYDEFHIAKEASAQRVENVARFLEQRYRDHPRRRRANEEWRVFLTARDKHQTKATELLGLLHDQDCTLPPTRRARALYSKSAAAADYLTRRRATPDAMALFIAESQRRFDARRPLASVRALSTIVEMHPGDSAALRLVGYRLLTLGQTGAATRVFDRVRRDRPFEPQSYRDLACSLGRHGRYPLAALQFEILLAGKWHRRFGAALRSVVLSDYRQLLDDAQRSGTLSGELQRWFARRTQGLFPAGRADQPALRVTLSWNTDSTDVDLWVVEPGGAACGHRNRKTVHGGRLLDDLTGGYGPERYEIAKVLPGEFSILVKFYRGNPNLLGGETHVDVLVERLPGTPAAETRRFQVVLGERGQTTEVCRVRFPAASAIAERATGEPPLPAALRAATQSR